MALFNKLFSNRKGIHNKHQDNVSEKFFAFSKDQVRVILFRECDFRGRKLLFDSNSVGKIPINRTKSGELKIDNNEKIAEIADGYGYVFRKCDSDFNQLAEMVFGSVAMSFRGTYFKMHMLESPNRLMFSQVFSSPRVSVSSRSDHLSFEHSRLDDSGASSTASLSEHLSVHSTVSDTVLVCRRPISAPLDVPVANVSVSIPSLNGDSGYSTNLSYANGPSSTWGSNLEENGTSSMSFSSSSLFKKWLRRNSTSLENSGHSLANSGSVQEGYQRHHRNSKLGLTLILQLTSGQEEGITQFLMEHVSLIETMLWRARQSVEVAYIKTQNFASLMVEMAQFAAQYLVNLLSGSYLPINLWLSLSNGCDNPNSISAFNASFSDRTASFELYDSQKTDLNSSTSSLNSGHESDFNLFNFTKFLKTDPFNIKRNFFGENRIVTAEKFIQEFCELLEDVDVKNTNFFMSTLLTAVLTYHLGWVNTCLPSAPTPQSRQPFNPLWGELSDLYGAVGHPTKIAQTIITGTNKKELISKILLSMTYFIRCCDVDRRVPVRAEILEENEIVEKICRKFSCIPKENYKKYEDHLKEIMNSNSDFLGTNKCSKEIKLLKKPAGLSKTKTCMGDLSQFLENESSKKTNENLIEDQLVFYSDKDVKSLLRIPSVSTLTTQNRWANLEKENRNSKQNVVFVLGDNEQLVGLKKDGKTEKLEIPKKPFLEISKYKDCDFTDSDFSENLDKNLIKPSTSWSTLVENNKIEKFIEKNRPSYKKYPRSQSEPPEERKPEDSKTKSKYRYSGVKFNLQQYPQILSNYMKSKNVEISNLQFGDKSLKFDELSSFSDTIISKYPDLDEDYEDGEALQTPSNASELEFTSDLFVAPSTTKQTKESNEDLRANYSQSVGSEEFVSLEDKSTNKVAPSSSNYKMKVIHLPMPKSKFYKPMSSPVRYTSSLMRAPSDSYMPDMVLQGPMLPKQQWESKLKSDLALASQHSLIDQPVEEAVAVIANTDTWEVQLMSSHTFLIDKGSTGIRIGMSQLVSNMLESLLQMWKLKVPPHFCLMHIEQTLQELCVRSKALSELLLASEFCNMEQLTSTLQLEVNDVPLLLAVASTHSPQVTQKYGLSFQ